jgi:NAD(P)-dependent dehydrogenase (short-subunit alcohol dehydrogenase family)
VSATIDATKLMRPNLLNGVHVLVTGAAAVVSDEEPPGGGSAHGFADAVAAASVGLGARVSAWSAGDVVAADVDQLVIDAAALFATADAPDRSDGGPRAALSACLDGAWEATRTVANAAFIEPGRPGRVVYLAPASTARDSPDATHVQAARAGLENLARTLSIEWARYAITLVTIAPSERTSADEVAAVTAFLGSPAGAYYSGCLLDLRGRRGAARRSR